MTDYLQPVHKHWRWISIAGCLVAFLGCVFIGGVIGWVIFRRHTITYNIALLWLSLSATFVAFLGLAALFSAWRIFRGKPSGNGLTVLPAWFIQAFGLFMFITHGVVFSLHGSVFFLIEGLIIFFAMILISRLVERKKRAAEERADQGWTEDPNQRS